jgi:segregation and condensation protein B
MKLKSQLEAILFLSDKPVKAAAMARIVSHDVQVVRQALLELIHDYEERDGGLEIADDDGYIIQVRDEYASIVDEFAPMEMPVALIRTLSAIAIKQPVAQSEIIKIRGAGAYDHIKELILRDLISKKEEGGRSPMLGTTKKFQEYFRLTQDAKMLRTQLVGEERAAKKAAESGAEGVEGDDGANFAPLDHEQEIAARTEAAKTAEAINAAEFVETGDTSNDIQTVGSIGSVGSVESIETPQVSEATNAMVTDETIAAIESIEGLVSIEALEAVEAAIEAIASIEAAASARSVEPVHVDQIENLLETTAETEIDLEKVFATSPDASFVFRPPTESKTSRDSRKNSRKISTPEDEQPEDGTN